MPVKQFAVFVLLVFLIAAIVAASLYASFRWPAETIAGLFSLPLLYCIWRLAGEVVR